MHAAYENASQRDPEKGDGPVGGAQHGSEDGSQPGDVEQLDQKNLPAGQRHVVHPVVAGLRRHRMRGVHIAEPLQVAAVGEIGACEQSETDQKGNHRLSF